MNRTSRHISIQLALVAVAVVWGSTFVMVKDAVESYPLFGFLGWRFAIAVLAFVVLFPRSLTRLTAPNVRGGLLAGVFLTAGYVLQTWGLTRTTASNAAFITGMFVVVTPVLQAVFLRRMPTAATLVGVAMAVPGLWLLTGGGSGWGVGDSLVFGCAVAYSIHMLVLGSLGDDIDVGALTLVQLFTVTVVCTAVSLVTEPRVMPVGVDVWVALAVTGVLASAVAFWVQTYAQQVISPARTALILVSEPAFGGLFGWFAGERLGNLGFVGAGLILGGMVVSEAASALSGKATFETGVEGPPIPVVDPSESAGILAPARSAQHDEVGP